MTSTDLRAANDSALVILIGRWDTEALSETYRRHAGAVFSVATRLLSERSRAEDVVQEIFLRLWNDPTSFDPQRGTLRTYLCTQTHSRAVDIMRSETSRRRRENSDVRVTKHTLDDLEREVVDRTVAAEVKDAIEQLPQTERAPIDLAYYKGHTYREVAELLGEPEGTVKSRIRSGLKRLRETLPAGLQEG